MPSGARPADRANQAHGRARAPFRAPSEGLRDPAPAQLAKGPEAAVGPAHTPRTHGDTHRPHPQHTSHRACKGCKMELHQFHRRMGHNQSDKNKTSVLCHMGSQLRT